MTGSLDTSNRFLYNTHALEVLHMTDTIHDQVKQALHHFRLPRYDEITDVGLYLDQTTRYINEYMFPLSEDMAITSSMISNYVKIHLIPSPSHKHYSRNQIAALICITMIKTIMSMDNIYILMHMYKSNMSEEEAYELFRTELDHSLHYVFGVDEGISDPANDHQMTDFNLMIRNMTIAIAHKIYLDVCFTAIAKSGTVELPQKKQKKRKEIPQKNG